ncbi:MAG: DUF2892 domain-containing protein [Bacteroidia bacterium]|jgi:hypothetical protein|nr:DUF2892 domain-containing protein [Bacteroidia bacterium]MBP7262176.1 DUF2892 domain-containing protein [Bacteroidia bacterium]MBP9181378.1 DUF2892 domain-containing protein [Bacteroidia bacterium]MBP9725667.1 DUF2892 domain-containing protein [Bacteroidia bacterium]
MKKNMSNTDRIIRILVSIVFVVLHFTGVVDGVLGKVLLALAAVFTLTSLLSYCPLYQIFGISTCKVKE